MESRKKIYIFVAIAIFLLSAVFFLTKKKPIKLSAKEIVVEVGDIINPLNYVVGRRSKDDISVENGCEGIKIGKCSILYEIEKYSATLNVNIVDSIAPIITVKDLKITAGEQVEAKSFIEKYEDKTNVVFSFVKEYDFIRVGSFEVEIQAIDEGGNKTTKTCKAIVTERVTLPSENEKVAWLTFDDGPSKNTLEILDMLDMYGIKATFFVTGSNPDYYHLIKEAYDRGHQIGLHTYSHDYSKVYSSEEAYYEDLNKIGEVVKKQIGFVPDIIRFPGGTSNTVSKKYSPGLMKKLSTSVLEKGYSYFDWNTSNGDGNMNQTKEMLLGNLKASVEGIDHVMILMHDGTQSGETVKALDGMLSYLTKQGYRFEGIHKDTFGFHHRPNN